MNQNEKEYGGFLPLELNLKDKNTKSYYDNYNIYSFNTVKASISLIKQDLGSEEIYVPYYLCPNVIAEIEKNFSVIHFYNINNNLLPKINNLENKIVYIVNYFGVMDNSLKRFVYSNKNTIFIIDNAHSFYCKPIISNNVYNLYSCKKFFGVPDGGYLITKKIMHTPYKDSFSNSISNYLIKSLEEGTNSCYKDKKEVDSYINNNYSGISVFSKKLMEKINYKKIKRIRHRNFKIYQKAFKKINHIKCEKKSIPYVYPLNVGINIKNELINQKIYVPTLWNMNENEDKIKFETFLKNNTIFLPLDQRYDVNDIEFIIAVVKELLENK